jgi:glycosyltransferase involved in cell wall biosynthesis
MKEATMQNDDIIIISPQGWCDYWVSKHWIAHELSSNSRVLFVGPPIWLGGLFRPSLTISTLSSLLADHTKNINDNLFYYRPILPLNISRKDSSPDIQQSVMIDAVAKYSRSVRISSPIVINFTTNHDFIGKFNEKCHVYYCVDPAFGETDEILMCNKTDLVYAISNNYKSRLLKYVDNNKITVIKHGFDNTRFSSIRLDDGITEPVEFKNIRKPIVGFVGAIHDMTIDVDLLVTCAKIRPQYSFVLIGPVKKNNIAQGLSETSLGQLSEVSNIHLLGSRPYTDVARYMKYFDVGLVLINHRIKEFELHTKQRTSFKIPQYFSQGLPVVSTPMDEYREIEGMVYEAADPINFAYAIDAALSETHDLKYMRIEYASRYSYESILEQIKMPIRKYLCGSHEQR